jgi:hypothetical protein
MKGHFKSRHLFCFQCIIRQDGIQQLILEPLRQHHRRDQSPSKDSVTHPCAHNLDPTGPICPSDRDKVIWLLDILVAANVLRKEGGNPRGGQHEDAVVESIVVL